MVGERHDATFTTLMHCIHVILLANEAYRGIIRMPSTKKDRRAGRWGNCISRATSSAWFSTCKFERNTVKLNDQSLMRDRAYVGGEWVEADSGASFRVVNPASGEDIGTVPSMSAADTAAAIDRASAAFGPWSARSAKEREKPLKEWARLIVANADDLAAILTLEQGKPLADARNEVLFAASFVEWFAEEAKRTYGEIIPGARRDVRFSAIKEPIRSAQASHHGICPARWSPARQPRRWLQVARWS